MIEDIAVWNHPAKAVFVGHGIKVRKVVLINRTYPVFHVSLPSVPKVMDKQRFVTILDELAKANGYWDYAVVDSTVKSRLIDIRVSCSRKDRKVTSVSFVSGESQFDSSTYIYRRTLESATGKVEILDISESADSNAIVIRLRGNVVHLSEESFVLSRVERVALDLVDVYALLTFVGPGLRCHQRYRMLYIDGMGAIKVSEPFGYCSEYVNATLNQKTLVLELKLTSGDEERKEILKWRYGDMIIP